jgi:hypothetical protein
MNFIEKSPEANVTGTGDFDFFVGSWNGVQRLRKAWLADCEEWTEFTSTTRCWKMFGGAANVDEVIFPELGLSGLSVRLLDPATGDWSIYWASSRDGILGLPPVIGRFSGITGFTMRESSDGRLSGRASWSDFCRSALGAGVLPDGGGPGDNWTADFRRPRSSGLPPEISHAARCKQPQAVARRRCEVGHDGPHGAKLALICWAGARADLMERVKGGEVGLGERAVPGQVTEQVLIGDEDERLVVLPPR